MLLLTALSLVLPTLILVYELLVSYKNVTRSTIIGSISLLVVFAVIQLIVVYLFMPSRNLLSIMMVNVFYSIITVLVMKSAGVEKTSVFWMAIGVVALVSLGGEAHSVLSVKPVYNSIKSSVSDDSEAPTFKKGVTPVALTTGTVKNRMNKAMSDVPNPQYYNLGDIEAQYYKGKPVYVASLEYDGFWRSHDEIPGYFIIDATDVNASPKFVKKPMKYSPSGYFGKNADRMIYRSYPTWLVVNGSKPQLEIDDDGSPYFIQTMYKSMPLSHRISYDKLHTVVLNAESGETNLYNYKTLPKWVDEGITSEVAYSMNKSYGTDSGGKFNQWFSHSGIKVPTSSDVTTVFDSKGNINYFTDFTRDDTKADSALGYSMINARTGKLEYYKTNGITDSDGATSNADQNYKAQKWHASMPVIYNINGRSVWVMSILDSTKAFRGYYYLDAKNQNINSSGSTANQALDSFRDSLASSSSTVGNAPDAKSNTVKGHVSRVAVISRGTSSIVLMTINNSPVVYTIDTSDYPNASLSKPNDEVSLVANVVNGKPIGNVTKFQNNSIR